MKACCDFFSPFFTAGGWAALGGAHYDFVKQIDAFDNYEIEVTIGGVGDKWVSQTTAGTRIRAGGLQR